MEAEGTRINKYLSEMGICSRREADRLLEAGRVSVNGRTAAAGQKIMPGDSVYLDGKEISSGHKSARPEPVVIAYNKPRGVVCTTVSQDRSDNIIERIGYESRIFPIGRLDKDSEGLILLTNIGELVNAVNRSVNFHEKEYEVRCARKLDDDFLDKMRNGVRIAVPARESFAGFMRDGKLYKHVITRKCEVSRIDEYSFRIILTQGLNRQIRRMCEALGENVVKLKRIRIMDIKLGRLKTGNYRRLEGRELESLMKLVRKPKNLGSRQL